MVEMEGMEVLATIGTSEACVEIVGLGLEVALAASVEEESFSVAATSEVVEASAASGFGSTLEAAFSSLSISSLTPVS